MRRSVSFRTPSRVVSFTASLVALSLLPHGLTAQQPIPMAADSLAIVAFAPALHVDLAHAIRLASGAYARELRVGRGDPVRVGAILTLRLRVRRPDGTVVRAAARPETRRWLPGTYVRGVEQGLFGMRAGGRRQLVLPPSLAYGDRLVPGVPAGTPLVVEIELLAVS
jgi:hypothetical protein